MNSVQPNYKLLMNDWIAMQRVGETKVKHQKKKGASCTKIKMKITDTLIQTTLLSHTLHRLTLASQRQ